MPAITFYYESASATLERLEDGTAKLTRVYAKNSRKGHGAGVVDVATTYADKNDLIVILEAQQFGNPRRKTMNTAQLIGFYKKFGFEITRTDPKPVLMRRIPT